LALCVKEKEMHLYNSIVKQKVAYAEHVLRGSSGDSALQIFEGSIEGKLYQGRPRRMWLDDLKEWTQLETYTDIKRGRLKMQDWKMSDRRNHGGGKCRTEKSSY